MKLQSIAKIRVRGIITYLEQKVKWHYEGNGMFQLIPEALAEYEHDLPILRSIVEDAPPKQRNKTGTSPNSQRDAIVHNNLVDMVGQQDADFLEAAGIDDIGCKE